MAKTKIKYVAVKEKDFLLAVKQNFSHKSRTYIHALVSALCLIADTEGTGEGLNRTLEDMDEKKILWLEERDLL